MAARPLLALYCGSRSLLCGGKVATPAAPTTMFGSLVAGGRRAYCTRLSVATSSTASAVALPTYAACLGGRAKGGVSSALLPGRGFRPFASSSSSAGGEGGGTGGGAGDAESLGEPTHVVLKDGDGKKPAGRGGTVRAARKRAVKVVGAGRHAVSADSTVVSGSGGRVTTGDGGAEAAPPPLSSTDGGTDAGAGIVPEVYPVLTAVGITSPCVFPKFNRILNVNTSQPEGAQLLRVLERLESSADPYVGCFLKKDPSAMADTLVDSLSSIYSVGCFMSVARISPVNESFTQVLLSGHRRIAIDGEAEAAAAAAAAAAADAGAGGDVGVVSDEELVDPADAGGVGGSFNPAEGIFRGPSGAEHEPASRGGAAQSGELGAADSAKPNPNADSAAAGGGDGGNAAATAGADDGPQGLRVRVRNLDTDPYDPQDEILKASYHALLHALRELIVKDPLIRGQIMQQQQTQSVRAVEMDKGGLTDAAVLADFAAQVINECEPQERQAALEELNVPARLSRVLELVKRAQYARDLQDQIEKDVQEQVSKTHKEFLLKEQLKKIRKELGEDGSATATREKFMARLEGKRVPAAVREVIDQEAEKMLADSASASTAEASVTRNYLDWLTALPYGIDSPEVFDVHAAATVLDADHYGMEEVKDRILEFIAVGKLRGTVQGKILCFVGPPGVGKTSIASSIAQALNRKFFRFSVGGMHDVAEIKGHRRTYVGAMPGKIVQGLKKTQAENPLILIDEIDKLGQSHRGDPASALLELFDPEQNNAFMDHYLDVPLDVSKVLFVCTANQAGTIPTPLRDRMEMMEVTGYQDNEKVAIAERYLVKDVREKTGISEERAVVTRGALERLVDAYTGGSGVRELKQSVEKIFRKLALQLIRAGVSGAGGGGAAAAAAAAAAAETTGAPAAAVAAGADAGAGAGAVVSPVSAGEGAGSPEAATTVAAEGEESALTDGVLASGLELPIVVDSDNLRKYAGNEKYQRGLYRRPTPVGMAICLAVTPGGGVALPVEVLVVRTDEKKHGGGVDKITGQVQSVMKESMGVGLSLTRHFLLQHFPDNRFFDRTSVHVHVPSGAVKKDGPSAGITVVSALLSVALNRPLRPFLGMTGEVSLLGRVMKVGGIKEKIMAAKRECAATCVVLPEENRGDYDELPDFVKEGVEVHFCSTYDDVFRVVFPDVPPLLPGRRRAEGPIFKI